MDGFGELLGGLGDLLGGMLGDGVEEAGAGGFGALFGGAREGRPETSAQLVIVYERYLCGGPRNLNINDR